MKALWLSALLCLYLASLCMAEEGLQFPTFDGKDRVIDINDKNYRRALKKYDMLCLLYHEPLGDNKELQKQYQMTELVLEVRLEDGWVDAGVDSRRVKGTVDQPNQRCW